MEVQLSNILKSAKLSEKGGFEKKKKTRDEYRKGWEIINKIYNSVGSDYNNKNNNNNDNDIKESTLYDILGILIGVFNTNMLFGIDILNENDIIIRIEHFQSKLKTFQPPTKKFYKISFDCFHDIGVFYCNKLNKLDNEDSSTNNKNKIYNKNNNPYTIIRKAIKYLKGLAYPYSVELLEIDNQSSENIKDFIKNIELLSNEIYCSIHLEQYKKALSFYKKSKNNIIHYNFKN